MPDAKPILFSGPMVRAILDGRKTQTRRVLPWQPGDLDRCFQMDDGSWHHCASDGTHMSPLDAPYAPGQHLWVREKHSFLESSITGCAPSVWYWADGSIREGDYTFPRPSIHMPRWASRLTLEVTDVRVQRVQEISEEDAVAEGLGVPNDRADRIYARWDSDPRDEFVELWDSLNAKRGYGWDANPWVVAITFRPHRANVDAVLREAAHA